MTRLTDEHGRDLGEIIGTSRQDSPAPEVNIYLVYVRNPKLDKA